LGREEQVSVGDLPVVLDKRVPGLAPGAVDLDDATEPTGRVALGGVGSRRILVQSALVTCRVCSPHRAVVQAHLRLASLRRVGRLRSYPVGMRLGGELADALAVTCRLVRRIQIDADAGAPEAAGHPERAAGPTEGIKDDARHKGSVTLALRPAHRLTLSEGEL